MFAEVNEVHGAEQRLSEVSGLATMQMQECRIPVALYILWELPIVEVST
jgi:hypothetical protein